MVREMVMMIRRVMQGVKVDWNETFKVHSHLQASSEQI